jgi:hypothetical protein
MLNEPATRSPWSWLQVMEGETLIQSLTRPWAWAGVPPSNNHAFGGTPESTGSGGGRGWLR